MQLQQNILVTKLYPPVARSGLIQRQRLGELLISSSLPKLVLVTAPAGYGKTTLLAQCFEFLRLEDYCCAWFSVDRSDSEPVEFLRYLISALQNEIAGVGEESLRTLENRSQIDFEEIVVSLINEIAGTGRNIAIFLDDFHTVESTTVTEIVRTLIAHAPPNLHFVLASRVMPDLSVARLRAHAEVVDISTENLRFDAEEVARFLRDARGFDLSDEQIERLLDRTEGWVAGLQLASLSLGQIEHRDEFIHSFSGKAREVAEYLAMDVLNRLAPDIQEFLLYTSILERLSAESCHCLVGRHGCQQILDQLEDSNTFLLPLDSGRTWYRYHHLFREFLLNQLRRTRPEVVKGLYQSASLWFAEQGYNDEAVTYALESGDFDRAALLVEQHADRLMERGQMPRVYGWLRKLPDAITERHPKLTMLRCKALFHMNQPEEAAKALHQAENVIERLKSEPLGYQNDELKVLLEEIKILRAGVACVHDDIEALERLASEPLKEKLIRSDDMGTMYNLLGYSRLVKGEFELARDDLEKSYRYHEQGGHSFGVTYSIIFQGMLNLIQGKMHRAAACFRQSEDVSILGCGERSAGVTVARVLQGVVLYEWNRIEEAEHLITENIDLVEECTIAEALVLGRITLARIRIAQHRHHDAEQCYTKIRLSCERRNLRRLLLLVENDIVRMLINQGEVAAAERVAGRLDIAMDGNPVAFSDRWEPAECLGRLIRARILLARGQADDALHELRRLRNLAVKAGRIQQSIEILILMAIAEFDRGAKDSMLKHIVTAMSLAPSSGFLRIFLDEGKKVASILKYAKGSAGDVLSASAQRSLQSVLAAIDNAGRTKAPRDARVPSGHGVVEELSARELEVLELIVSGRSNVQIGEQLAIAESTVKWHVKNIFGKLGVKNRTSAARAAQQLELITR